MGAFAAGTAMFVIAPNAALPSAAFVSVAVPDAGQHPATVAAST